MTDKATTALDQKLFADIQLTDEVLGNDYAADGVTIIDTCRIPLGDLLRKGIVPLDAPLATVNSANTVSVAGPILGQTTDDKLVVKFSQVKSVAGWVGLATAAQGALADTALQPGDVVDDLTTGGSTVPGSAEQIKVLKGFIDAINVILTSDDVDLDDLQEVVDFIQANRDDLDNLGIANIAGLQVALDLKANLLDVYTRSAADAAFATAAQGTKADTAAQAADLAVKANIDLVNVNAASVTLSLLAAEVITAMGSKFDPALGQGDWVPATDSPTIPAAGTAGRWYRVDADGTASGTNADGDYEENDIVVDNGTDWVLFRFPSAKAEGVDLYPNADELLFFSDAQNRVSAYARKSDGTWVIPKLSSPVISDLQNRTPESLDAVEEGFVFPDAENRVTAYVKKSDGTWVIPKLSSASIDALVAALEGDIDALETSAAIAEKERVAARVLSAHDYSLRLDHWASLPVSAAKTSIPTDNSLPEKGLYLPNAHTRTADPNSSMARIGVVFIDDDQIDSWGGLDVSSAPLSDWENWSLQTPPLVATNPYRAGYFSGMSPIFAAHGVPACEGLIARRSWAVGNQSEITLSKILEKYYGWEMLSHSTTHSPARWHGEAQQGGGSAEFVDYDEALTIAELQKWGIPYDLTIYNPVFEWITSYHRLKSWGINVRNAVYPFGSNTHEMREIVSQCYRCGVGVGGLPADGDPIGVNRPPLATYNLARYGLDNVGTIGVDAAGAIAYGDGVAIPVGYTPSGAVTETYDKLPHDQRDGLLATWKSAFDSAKAIADTGVPVVMIFMTHWYNKCWVNFDTTGIDRGTGSPDDWTGADGYAALESQGGDYPDAWVRPGEHMANLTLPSDWEPMPNTRAKDVFDFVGYIKSEGGEIMTMDRAIDIFGNPINIGDYTRGQEINDEKASVSVPNFPHHVVGIDGSASYQPNA